MSSTTTDLINKKSRSCDAYAHASALSNNSSLTPQSIENKRSHRDDNNDEVIAVALQEDEFSEELSLILRGNNDNNKDDETDLSTLPPSDSD